jgi:hypothetical protein
MDKTVFIAMPFDPSFNDVYKDAILPAIRESKLVPYRVNELKVNSDIVQDIEQGIKNAAIVLADFTNKNSNVFYEVGFARAIGKNLISATQKREDVPFDLRQRRYIIYKNTPSGLGIFKREIKLWINEILKNPSKHNLYPKVFVHGTKFDVPDKNEFWNDLCKRAEKRFFLLGGTNKSWVNKSEHQSQELADSILRIVKNRGIVRIISNDSASAISDHREFFNKHIKPEIKSRDLFEKFKKTFMYGVIKDSNYQAVISDDRIVLLPTMNSSQFKDESLVMELEGSHLPQFKNYLADIERLFKENKCRVIDLAINGNGNKNTGNTIKTTRRK